MASLDVISQVHLPSFVITLRKYLKGAKKSLVTFPIKEKRFYLSLDSPAHPVFRQQFSPERKGLT
jgi:hypothetical protein